MDSLCAPLLVLNYHCEARAFVCLQALTKKYLRHLFAEDNSRAMERMLSIFSKLLIYHDPELGLHLKEKKFTPELYGM